LQRESIQIYLKNQFIPKTNTRKGEFFSH